MCFSAGASFAAAAVLGGTGIATLKVAKEKNQIPFAIIPLIFAIQQLSEGFVWMGLSDPRHSSWSHLPVYIFLVFAQIVWPSWAPLSILSMEQNKARRRILQIFLIIGLTISGYLMYCLFAYDVSAKIEQGHIQYTLNFPLRFTLISSVMYVVSTVLSLFVSSVKKMTFLGIAILITLLISRVFFDSYFISVWCFFAAVISLIVYYILRAANKKPSLEYYNPDVTGL